MFVDMRIFRKQKPINRFVTVLEDIDQTHGPVFKVLAYISVVQMQLSREILDDQDERC
jgi:hypothetical protein